MYLSLYSVVYVIPDLYLLTVNCVNRVLAIAIIIATYQTVIHNTSPVLRVPDFQKQFKLFVDVSDVGVGAVLLQKIFLVWTTLCAIIPRNYQKNYSTSEKETLLLFTVFTTF